MYLRCVAREYFVASIDLSDWMKEINRVHCSVNDIDKLYLILFDQNINFVTNTVFPKSRKFNRYPIMRNLKLSIN